MDRVAVSRLRSGAATTIHPAHPVVVNVAITKRLTHPVVGRPSSYLALAQAYPLQAIASGLLMFDVTAVVVYTMRSVNVALVATVREFSIVFAAVIGILWLKESITWLKTAAIFLIVVGVVLIVL